MSGLPSSWMKVRLDRIADVRLGRQRSPKRAVGPHMRSYLRAANVTWRGIDISDLYQMDFAPAEMSVYALRQGDILLSEASGSASEVGKPGVWMGQVENCAFQNTLIRVRAPEALVSYLHFHFLKDALNGLFARSSRGVGIHHLGAEAMSAWEVVLPPLAEQHRIVAEIEKQFTRLDAAVSTLERVKANLRRARASVLKAAVEGRLVPTEAENAGAEGRGYEPASALLNRILDERKARWPKGKKYKPPVEPEADTLPDLPEGWKWTSMAYLAAVSGGVTKNSRRENLPLKIAYLRVANVYANELRLDDVTEIGVMPTEMDRILLSQGDLLIVEGNGSIEQIGRAAIWNGEISPCIHQNHIIKARPMLPGLSRWVLLWMSSPNGRRHVERVASSTSGLHTLSLSKVEKLPTCLPPLAEQTRIIAEVERQLTILDNLATTIDRGLAHCKHLRQSILKRAFEGKLVPQDPNDEPASALLARIQNTAKGQSA